MNDRKAIDFALLDTAEFLILAAFTTQSTYAEIYGMKSADGGVYAQLYGKAEDVDKIMASVMRLPGMTRRILPSSPNRSNPHTSLDNLSFSQEKIIFDGFE